MVIDVIDAPQEIYDIGVSAEEIVFCPSYDGLLWRSGRPLRLNRLGLGPALLARTREWYDQFDEARLPVDDNGDVEWLRTGADVLFELRNELRGRYTIRTEHPWWSTDKS